MADLADATARWSAKALGLRPRRRSWVHIAGPRTALVSVAAHTAHAAHAARAGSGSQQQRGSQRRQRRTEAPDGGPPQEGAGDYPGENNDGKFPRYEAGVNDMIDQCKKPKDIKEKAMSGEDTRRAFVVNMEMLTEYQTCVERIHEMALLVQEAGDFSREKNVEYNAEAVKFLKELAFIEDYAKSFKNIQADASEATEYLLKESDKVTKYLNDLVDRGEPAQPPDESKEPCD